MSDASLISTDVDYDRDGKQFGRLAVPQSTNSAGWAKYFVPIVVVRNGEGPSVALFAGDHGDAVLRDRLAGAPPASPPVAEAATFGM